MHVSILKIKYLGMEEVLKITNSSDEKSSQGPKLLNKERVN